MREAADTIKELVTLHGEGGVCPASGDWQRIFEHAGPIHIINLLKFKDRIDTEDGSISGAQAYRRYSSSVAPVFSRMGGERIFHASVTSAFGVGEILEWDAAILTRYPSCHELAQMWLDPEFVAAHKHRIDGVERSHVMVF